MANLTDYSNTDLYMAESSYTSRPYSFDKTNKRPPAQAQKSQWYKQEKITDNKTGYTAYFLTNNQNPNLATQAYYVVRGSDAFDAQNPDWTGNNIPFALADKQVKQSKNFIKDVQTKMSRYTNITAWNFTGHSLATMVVTTGLSNLSQDQATKVQAATLFNGPDVTNSLNVHQLNNLKDSGLNDKITYYLNPDDMVSVLNRSQSEQIGHVNWIDTKSDYGTMDIASSHDFYEYQVVNGKIKTVENSLELKTYIYAQDALYQQLINHVGNLKLSPKKVKKIIETLDGEKYVSGKINYLVKEFGNKIDIHLFLKFYMRYKDAKEMIGLSNRINSLTLQLEHSDDIKLSEILVSKIEQYIGNFLDKITFDTEMIHVNTRNKLQKLINEANMELSIAGSTTQFDYRYFYSEPQEKINQNSVSVYKKDMEQTLHILTNHVFEIYKIDVNYANNSFKPD
ncbi:MAG: hypothetical protein LBM27_01370 [Lactobacillaceae bacterium]|jgi:hypothetical protein|nr:hypothetical protein [Lactobacillaceae bacterium]